MATQSSTTTANFECHLDDCTSWAGVFWHGHDDPYMERFWTKVDRNGPLPEEGTLAFGSGPCWVWLDAPMKLGYGRFTTATGVPYAHRYIYEHGHGGIPDGLEIDHLCNMRNCVNPAHLEAVSQRENIRRSWDFRRYRKALGLGPRVPYIPIPRSQDQTSRPVVAA